MGRIVFLCKNFLLSWNEWTFKWAMKLFETTCFDGKIGKSIKLQYPSLMILDQNQRLLLKGSVIILRLNLKLDTKPKTYLIDLILKKKSKILLNSVYACSEYKQLINYRVQPFVNRYWIITYNFNVLHVLYNNQVTNRLCFIYK